MTVELVYDSGHRKRIEGFTGKQAKRLEKQVNEDKIGFVVGNVIYPKAWLDSVEVVS